MAEKKVNVSRFNIVSRLTNAIFSLIFFIPIICIVVPLVLVVIISFTDNSSIQQIGYSFFPNKWSLSTYKEVWGMKDFLFRAFSNSLFITVVGTILGLFLNTSMGYVLSRKSFKFKKLYKWIVVIPIIFNGGMVVNCYIIAKTINLYDNILALILPIAVSSFYVIVLRTFFIKNIPEELIDSGRIEGASQIRIFFQIVLPMSIPVLVTVGFILSSTYWNDWFNAAMYIENENLYPLQYLLIRFEQMAEQLNRYTLFNPYFEINFSVESTRIFIVILTVTPIVCAYAFFQKYFVAGLTVGAIKD